MLVTVLTSRYVAAGGAALAVPLAEALAHEWPTDAHCTQYAPIAHAQGDAIRGAKEAVDRFPLQMVALLGDLDAPNHVAAAEWRERAERCLEASPFAWYATSNGYRVVAKLDVPFVVDSPSAWDEWRGRYAGFVDECLRDYWLELDPSASDPSRLFRLPNVEREGVGPVRSAVRGSAPRWTLPAPVAPGATQAAERRAPARSRETAIALAQRLPPSVEGHGGDAALLRAASEVSTIVKGDEEATYSVLVEAFNPRCVPPWSAAKLRREAQNAAERYVGDIGRRFLDAREARGVPPDSFGAVVDRARPPRPLPYVVESLGLAPGKCSAIQGAAGDGKTPFALLLAICVATGTPFLGHAITRSGPVLYLAYEGGPLVEERDARICAGLGLAREETPLTLVHADRQLDSTTVGQVEKYAEQHAPTMIIVDTYSAALPAGIDANLSLYAEPLRQLGKVSDATGALVVVLLHHRKSGGGLEAITGHSTIAGALQASVGLHREDPEGSPASVTVSCRRAPRATFRPFGVEWQDKADPHAPTGLALVAARKETVADIASPKPPTAAERKSEKARRRILAALQNTDHERRKTLVEIAAQGAMAGNDALENLRETGAVEIDPHGYVSLVRGS